MSNVIDCREQKLVFHESVRQVLYSTRWQLVRGFSLILMRADNLRPVSQSLVARILLAARFVVSVQLTRTPRPAGPRWAGPPRSLACGRPAGRTRPSRAQ